MDLSKAFDCLPHDFIIDKLSAYGLSDTAYSFLQIYLSDKKQMVELGQNHSSWLNTIKGVPQKSMLGLSSLLIHLPSNFVMICIFPENESRV